MTPFYAADGRPGPSPSRTLHIITFFRFTTAFKIIVETSSISARFKWVSSMVTASSSQYEQIFVVHFLSFYGICVLFAVSVLLETG